VGVQVLKRRSTDRRRPAPRSTRTGSCSLPVTRSRQCLQGVVAAAELQSLQRVGCSSRVTEPAGSWLQQQSYRACRELVAAQSYRACRELVAAAEFKPPAASEWKRHISVSRAADAKGDGIMRLRGSGGGYIRGWATAPWEPCLFNRID
jgi:hypothetical protein